MNESILSNQKPIPKTEDEETCPDAPCSPLFFAGWAYTEDTVSGGTGDSIEEAIADYFGSYAEQEVEDAIDFEIESDPQITVDVWSLTHERDDNWIDEWHWMFKKKVASKTYNITRLISKRYPELWDYNFERKACRYHRGRGDGSPSRICSDCA